MGSLTSKSEVEINDCCAGVVGGRKNGALPTSDGRPCGMGGVDGGVGVSGVSADRGRMCGTTLCLVAARGVVLEDDGGLV